MLSPPPRDFPLKDVLVSTEIACKHLSAPKAQGLKAEVTKCINKAKRPASNISKGEFKALQELKADTDFTILPADKGRSTVMLILNTKDYESKMSILLSDINMYEVLQKDPTPKIKREEKKKSLRCMAYLRSTRRMSLYDQSLQAEEASYTWQTFLAPLVGKSECHIKNSRQDQESRGAAGTESDIIQCFSTVHQHSGTRCHQSSPYQIGRGPKAPRSYPSVTGEDP